MPISNNLLLPVPTLKLESVNWYGEEEVVTPDLDWTLFRVINPPVGVLAETTLDGELGTGYQLKADARYE